MIKSLNVFCKIAFFVSFIGVAITSFNHDLNNCLLLFGIQIVCAYTAILTEEV